VTALMCKGGAIIQRKRRGGIGILPPEGTFRLRDWLLKMWNGTTQTLYERWVW